MNAALLKARNGANLFACDFQTRESRIESLCLVTKLRRNNLAHCIHDKITIIIIIKFFLI